MHPPLVFKTYQDVKNNLVYWTFVLLVLSTLSTYFLLLTDQQRAEVGALISSLGSNTLMASLGAILVVAAYFLVSIVLIYAFQIHDLLYDGRIIKWRERYDIDFILRNLSEPFRHELPGDFLDLGRSHRYDFMKPFYDFVGDGKPGIRENTRVRFYERITWYWATQLNEMFILVFLLGIPGLIIAGALAISAQLLSGIVLALVVLGIVNRWLIRATLTATRQVTSDEIQEILEKPENLEVLKAKYKDLCKTYKG